MANDRAAPPSSGSDTVEAEVRFTPEQVEAAEQQINERTKRIEYYTTEYSIELLAKKMRDKEYVVPEYQRAFTWEEQRKSRFIESVLMGLPIPFLFFWEDPASGKLEVVDGSQRLRTLEEFLYNDLVVNDLERLPAVDGFRFSDLPESRQRKIQNRSIRGIVLKDADEEARTDLFDRINTGSKVANKAEIRRGVLKGPFLDLVIDLAKDPLFVQLAPLSEKQVKERGREELVTRFFAYGDGLEEYADEVSPFLFAYSQRMNKLMAAEQGLDAQYRERFNRVMGFVQKTFPYGFRKSPSGKATPRARFEALAVGSQLALAKRPELVVSATAGKALIETDDFTKVVRSDGASNTANLEARLNYVRDQLLKAGKGSK